MVIFKVIKDKIIGLDDKSLCFFKFFNTQFLTRNNVVVFLQLPSFWTFFIECLLLWTHSIYLASFVS